MYEKLCFLASQVIFFFSLIIRMLIKKNMKLEIARIVSHKALKFVFEIIEFEPNFVTI